MRGEKGFTLLEVVVALTVAMMVVLVGTIALRTYLSSYERQKRAVSEVERKAFFAFIFFKQLQNIPDRVFGVVPIFEGEEDRLRFVSRTPMTGRYFPGFFAIEFRVKNGRIIERDFPLIDVEDYKNFLEESGDMNAKWFVVFTLKGYKNEDIHFEYFDGKVWRRDWKLRGKLPAFIAIKTEDKTLYVFPVMYFSR